MDTHQDEPQLEAAKNALEELEPKNQLTDKMLINSIILQISNLKSKGVKYRAIYEALVKSAGMKIGYTTFVIYAREAQKMENSTDSNNVSPLSSDEPISAPKSRRF